MNDVLFRPYLRRSRCEITGCRCFASYEIGPRPNRPLLVLCEQHARDLQGSVNSIMNKKYHNDAKAEAEKEEPKVEEPKTEEIKAEAAVEPKEAEVVERATKKRGRPPRSEQTKPIVKPEPGTEFYTCKYCGEKFDKAYVDSVEFAQHSKKCKKEHFLDDAVVSE